MHTPNKLRARCEYLRLTQCADNYFLNEESTLYDIDLQYPPILSTDNRRVVTKPSHRSWLRHRFTIASTSKSSGSVVHLS